MSLACETDHWNVTAPLTTSVVGQTTVPPVVGTPRFAPVLLLPSPWKSTCETGAAARCPML